MIAILKKLGIILGVILVILLIWRICTTNNTKIKLFESVDTDSIVEINIFNPRASFNTNSKNDILEIMNYLKSVNLCENSDKRLPNTTPDAQIALEDEEGKTISSVAIYGDIAILYPDDGKWYTVSGSIYSNLEELCKKLRNK
ncbi:hypothetical protein CLOBY_08490 [Clostridium saccharobutylicum]|uniref:hypothetical protein n=1 Tax=Clostridium saccharobutylicum TaxID=169679 RepID=UPI000983CA3D|nr:hypothetical protein [Clostridium saccharobutylicum]AQS08739.1 hypothetical protein CLOBY_08490 [Clostridium saccharobutylicum]MBC2438746.1 hypothetical protein [Clostridium saccharobutylicum]NSB91031.1 hypothetical protein [Clostridium saccharobutylicum]NYC28915.1 hypothetical protein [Clostridium saccharobutylicum]OOM18385.1 hypothetical protein CLSAB_07460 [Clostridium saccharobutylicum]